MYGNYSPVDRARLCTAPYPARMSNSYIILNSSTFLCCLVKRLHQGYRGEKPISGLLDRIEEVHFLSSIQKWGFWRAVATQFDCEWGFDDVILRSFMGTPDTS